MTSQSFLPVVIVQRHEPPHGVAREDEAPAVDINDIMPARWSYFHAVRPVDAEMARTVPRFVPPSGMKAGPLTAHDDGARTRSFELVAFAQRFCSGMYMRPVFGL